MVCHVKKAFCRAGVVVLAGLLMVGALCPPGSAAPSAVRASASGSTDRTTWAERAFTSYAALQRHLYLGADQHHLYLEKYPHDPADNAYSYLWPMREATAATIDLSIVPGTGSRFRSDVRDRFAGLSAYLNPDHDPPGYASYVVPPLGGGGDLFYDDNSIVGLEFVRRYLLENRLADRRRAEQIFDVLVGGWDTDTSHACPGGMFWVDATWTSIRAANVTGLTAELAAHLYELTRDKSYLDWAERLYDWNRTCLRSSEGLYQNDISLDGTVNPTLWIYNSGAMIGAGALLHRATGDPRYLAQARTDAAAALDYWTDGNRYYDQPAVFNAIFFKNLMLLDSVRHDSRYRAVVEAYAEHVWGHNRDAALGLFRFPPSGGGPYDPSYRPETLEQAAVIQTFALLAWDRGHYRFAA
ncbi:glycoside hydrolase family 76 protein [Actinopolymorpha singaporensis]|uniref:Glycosyl hydrolase family 76 n=1 Tax=Actinopolymorpha singaporensis TaxID=117157 RepID=A0A1H1RB12_9ACTN|nr:glycoside hydrolase family 76 protein [Actinopolymorpha singaporensis]SDS32957.1 Glycosyl hydrolase family 76 [Actinopolymorpha singaporensis]